MRAGDEQALALVDAQRLRVHARELRRDRDDVERPACQPSAAPSGRATLREQTPHAGPSSSDLRERLDRVALLVVELGRHLHVDGDEQVAASCRCLAVGLHAPPADAQHLAARRARRDPHRHLAVERRHLHVGAERRFRERDRQLQREVVAAAAEQRVRRARAR